MYKSISLTINIEEDQLEPFVSSPFGYEQHIKPFFDSLEEKIIESLINSHHDISVEDIDINIADEMMVNALILDQDGGEINDFNLYEAVEKDMLDLIQEEIEEM